MKTFRTTDQFAVTRGANNRRIGTAYSIEYAEALIPLSGLRTEYTIWRNIDGRWIAWRSYHGRN